MPFLGHATITKVLRWLSFVFIAVFAVMAVLIVPHVHLSSLHQSASWADWTTALVVIISVGGLGWTENGNDYSRYLPRTTPKARTFWAAALGPAIPSLLLELLGAAAFAISPKTDRRDRRPRGLRRPGSSGPTWSSPCRSCLPSTRSTSTRPG